MAWEGFSLGLPLDTVVRTTSEIVLSHGISVGFSSGLAQTSFDDFISVDLVNPTERKTRGCQTLAESSRRRRSIKHPTVAPLTSSTPSVENCLASSVSAGQRRSQGSHNEFRRLASPPPHLAFAVPPHDHSLHQCRSPSPPLALSVPQHHRRSLPDLPQQQGRAGRRWSSGAFSKILVCWKVAE
ncbi:hypothetical protein PIB30_049407 [Stylosanthes scabra]|uniref:Uncharacterized protein n=1 Tax=Stylosanthes scabra TaxID=79078 RepID=A0ABU6ZG34_9FABA|nr:hypothetical protein [Stylosanthes scabra]